MAGKYTALHYIHTLYIVSYCSTYLGRYKKMSTTIGMLVGTIFLVVLMGSLVLIPMAVYGITVGSLPPVIPVTAITITCTIPNQIRSTITLSGNKSMKCFIFYFYKKLQLHYALHRIPFFW